MSKISHDSETETHGQQVLTACAFIHQKVNGVEKVFLPKRADSKKFLPGVYEIPGGHVDFGEEMVAGLQREIAEEFGMTIDVGDPFFVFTYTNEIKGSHSIEVVYFASFREDPGNVTLNPEDHSGYLWLAEDELRQAETEGKSIDDDIEFAAMKKGFALLRGEPSDFATPPA